MWMLANRLYFMDMDIKIRNDSPPVLRSARLAYATNCVRVFKSGDDCVCAWDEDSIRLHDVDLSEAFELVQSVFDFYEDWSREIIKLASERKYQELVDHCWRVFHSPMLIMDGNYKVLGISSRYKNLDEEWEYISKYGHSSVRALQDIRNENKEIDKPVMQTFKFSNIYLRKNGITCPLLCDGVFCGRVNVFEHERILNTGDKQILEFVASLVASSLSSGRGIDSNPYAQVFSNLLDGKDVGNEDIERIMSVMRWDRNGYFQVFILTTNRNSKDKGAYYILISTLYSLFPDSYVIFRNDGIVLVTQIASNANAYMQGAAETKPADERNRKEELNELCKKNGIELYYSLALQGINNLHYCYDQALFAIELASTDKLHKTCHDFYYYAIYYIIKSRNFDETLHACHPDILYLKGLRDKTNYDPIETLKCYLDNNRSVLHTANELFLHRNSMVYRIQKITQALRYSLDDAYTRDYMRLSIRILELLGHTDNSLTQQSCD